MSLFTEDFEFSEEELPVDDREEAGAWPRFWSRLFDTSLELTILTAAVALLFPDLYRATTNHVAGSFSGFGLGILLLPVAIIADAIMLSFFGTTIGRALAGIRVEWPSGRSLNLQTALSRNLRVYVVGMAFGIPVICLFTYFMNHERLNQGQQAPWDETLGTRVYDVRSTTNRTVLVAMSFIGLHFVNAIFTHEFDRASAGSVLRVESAKIPLADPDPLDPMINHYPAPPVPVPPISDPVANELIVAAAAVKPRMIDPNTRIDRAEAKGRELTYFYTILRRQIPDNQFSPIYMKAVRDKACASPPISKLMRDFHGSIRSVYQMPGDAKPLEFTIRWSDC